MLRSVLSIGLLLSLAQASPHPHIKKASSHTHAATVGPNRVLSPAVHPDVDPSNINNLKACANASLFYSGAQDSAAANTMGLVTVPATQYPVVQLENSGSLHNMSCTTTSAQIDFVNSQAYQTAVSDWTSQGTFALVTYNPNCGAGFESDKREFILVKSLTPVPATNSIVVNAQFVDFQTVVGNASDVTVDFGPNIAAQTVSKRGSKSLSDTFPFNEYATSDTTPFGAGYQLFSDSTLTLDCVGCGTQGSITISGSVSYSIFPPGIHSVSVGTNGNLAVTMVVGVVANGLHVNVPIDTINILTVPLTPFEIPGIFSIGPQIQLQAKAAIGVTATGSLLSGVTLDWPAFSATINADGNGASASGFTPTVTPTNSANGTISASLNVGLPVSFGIGINILDGLLTKSISLVDEPGVSFTASGSNVGPCDGVGLSVGVFNDVSVSVLGITSIPVASWNDTLASVCISDG
ncbi:MAG: hypothetical protein MMC33_001586 [Icmadophila ericetorum]|nr:hypothetical protein [Icmadophila ericetorum]